jgi:hypothetical protein
MMESLLRSLLRRIRRLWCSPEKPDIDRPRPPAFTGDAIVFDTSSPMALRLKTAAARWSEQGRVSGGLLTGEAFFAARCWVLQRDRDPDAPPIDPVVADLVLASLRLAGGDDGWHRFLERKTPCPGCGTVWRLENIRYCTGCMGFVCIDCAEGHRAVCGREIVG